MLGKGGYQLIVVYIDVASAKVGLHPHGPEIVRILLHVSILYLHLFYN